MNRLPLRKFIKITSKYSNFKSKSEKKNLLKFGHSEKSTKFEKIFHFRFDITQLRQILSGRFFQIFCLSQVVQTLHFIEK